MKRIIVLLAVIIISLIAAIPVIAQTNPESEWGYPLPDPPNTCCYDIDDNPAVCDEYYELHPDELCEDCPTRCKEKFAPKPLIIVWFQKMVKWVTSLFE